MGDDHQDELTRPPYVERRKDVHSQTLLRLIDSLTKAVDELRREQETARTNMVAAIKEAMAEAFPEGDADGHRRHHEAVIQAAEERAEFWSTMKKELSKWGLIGVAGWLVYYVWLAFLKGPLR